MSPVARWVRAARHTTGAMFITNHVLAGTIAGSVFRRRPVLAFVVGFAHARRDGHDAALGEPHARPDGFYAVAKRDGLLGPRRDRARHGGGRATADRVARRHGRRGDPRLGQAGEFFFGVNPMPKWLDRFHKEIQRESPEGMRTELAAGVALAATCAAVLLGRRRRYQTRRYQTRTRG